MATDARNDLLLQAALEYAGYGWRVLPLRDGKIPRLKAWQKAATVDEEVIAGWWEQNPNDNVGVQLGPDSGIIDIECDNDQAEKDLSKLFDNNFPVTPTWQSKRGKHRLFKWRGDLPEPGKNGFHWGAVEIRTGNGEKGAQSVFPPSRHPDGHDYAWLVPPGDAEVAELPNLVLVRLWNTSADEVGGRVDRQAKPQEHWDQIAKGVSAGERNESAASFIGRMLSDLKNPFDADAVGRLWASIQRWNDLNRPPLADDELKRTFASILQRHRMQRTNESFSPQFSQERPFSAEAPEIIPEWRLEIVKTNPRSYRLYSPLWSLKAKGGFIKLDTTAQLLCPESIRRLATEQAGVWVNRKFNKLWEGDKDNESLAKQLIDSAEYVEAPLEGKRDLVIAELLLDQVAKGRSRQIEEGGMPDSHGRPCTMPDGSVVFKFSYVWEPLARGADKIKQGELSEVMEKVGVRDRVFGPSGSRKRYKVINHREIKELERMIGLRDDESVRHI